MRAVSLAGALLALGLCVGEPMAQPLGPRGVNPARFAGAPAANAVVIVQDGAGNSAGVVQRGRDLSAAIVQEGDANTACVMQIGRGHATELSQSGDGLAAMVLRTPTRQRVWEGASAANRARRVCGF